MRKRPDCRMRDAAAFRTRGDSRGTERCVEPGAKCVVESKPRPSPPPAAAAAAAEVPRPARAFLSAEDSRAKLRRLWFKKPPARKGCQDESLAPRRSSKGSSSALSASLLGSAGLVTCRKELVAHVRESVSGLVGSLGGRVQDSCELPCRVPAHRRRRHDATKAFACEGLTDANFIPKSEAMDSDKNASAKNTWPC